MRLDGYEKARGIARYTGDLQLPGTLHTALLRSPFARCRVKRIDLAAAAAAPGVLGVLGPGEVRGVDAEANFEGAAVGAVAAETFAEAEAAVRLIDVEWEELEPLLDADEAVRQGSLVAETRQYERGDFDAGIAAADAVVEGDYRTQTLNHNPLETHQCLCQWRGDALDVYVSTQYIWGTRNEVAAALELAPDKVRVICEFMGGGFGAKAGSRQLDPARRRAREADRAPGGLCGHAPRRERRRRQPQRDPAARHRRGARRRHAHRPRRGVHLRAGMGRLAGTDRRPGQLLYACDNVRTVEHGAKLNLPPMAAFRAPGFVEGTWSLECMLDKLAAQLGVDPLEIRKLNYANVDTMDGALFVEGLMECYRRAEPHWERRHEVRARSDEIWKRGMGMASQIWYGGGGPPSYAWVRLGSDGGRTSSPRCRTSAPAPGPRWRRSLPRSSALALDRV